MSDYPKRPLIALTTLVALGTLYSVVYDTYLDTSNPLLTHLPHPLHATHYFASKKNVVNVFFTKRLWAWTSASFLLLYVTSPARIQHRQRLFKWLALTLLWLSFTAWFFGPSLLDRLTINTGGECVVNLPSGALVSVPDELCYSRARVTPSTHPALFAASLVLPPETWSQVPRIRRGHDVSGHLFLLTIAVLFLSEQFSLSFGYHRENRNGTNYVPKYHWIAVASTIVVLGLAYFATWTTSVYFHTPAEKISGFLLGVLGYSITRLPALRTHRPDSRGK